MCHERVGSFVPLVPPSDIVHAQGTNGEFLIRNEDARREKLHEKRRGRRLLVFSRGPCHDGDSISILPS